MSLPAAATNDDAGDDALSSYEQLRARVLTGAARCGHVGRGVLLREGMAAWMARRPTCSPSVDRGARYSFGFFGIDDAIALMRAASGDFFGSNGALFIAMGARSMPMRR